MPENTSGEIEERHKCLWLSFCLKNEGKVPWLRKHPGIEAAWILRVMAEPLEERQQPDGRYALWGLVPNAHNAFFDRGYLKAIFRSQPPPPQALPPSR